MAKKGKKPGGAGGGKKKGDPSKAREKVIQDKTFGMKNKGGKKVKAMKEQIRNSAMSTKAQKAEQARRDAMKMGKLKAEQEKAEMAKLFKQVGSSGGQNANVDPKSIVCEFFKKGACRKGKKCKFSHEWSQVRRVEKIDLYADPREGTENLPPMDAIPCKHFIDAVEKQQYGFFWSCPNGGAKCQYRHCLPEGFILKTDKEKKMAAESKDDGETLEDALDRMVAELKGRTDLTPLTLEAFNQWKINKKKKQADERKERAEKAQKEKTRAADKTQRFLSGRDLFEYDRSLFVDDADADDEQYVIESDAEGDDSKADTSKKSAPPVKPEPKAEEPEAERTDDTAKSDASPHENGDPVKKKKKKRSKKSKSKANAGGDESSEPPLSNGGAGAANGAASSAASAAASAAHPSSSEQKEPPDTSASEPAADTAAADLSLVGDESLFLDDDLLDDDLLDDDLLDEL